VTDTNEKADLEQLLSSPGWLRYEHALGEFWRTQWSAHVEAAANDREDAMALQKLRQVIAAQKAVTQALSWPKERLAQLSRAKETVTSFTRGGYDSQTPR
jgi:hypothetical protein